MTTFFMMRKRGEGRGEGGEWGRKEEVEVGGERQTPRWATGRCEGGRGEEERKKVNKR